MSVIIVEGPDCSGKSTFVAELVNQAPAKTDVLHFGPPTTSDPFEEYEHTLYRHLAKENGRQHLICDRLHWGERVYGPLLRSRDRMGIAGWRHIELFLAAQDAVVVYMHQPSTVLIDRLNLRGDALIKTKDLASIEIGYQWCLRNTILPVVGLRDPDWFHAIELTKRNRVGFFDQYPTYIGSIRPSGLLFGEIRNQGDNSPDRSAFVPRSATSGRYLLEALPEDTWPHLGIANALEEDVEDLWLELSEVPVCALGAKAHKRLSELKIPHATVPHPQYVRRFCHSSQVQYGELIRNVMGSQGNWIDWRG